MDTAVKAAVEIRRARESDLPWLIGELRRFSVFVGTKVPIFPDDGHVERTLRLMMESHVFLVAEEDGESVGFIAGLVGPHPYNPSIRTLVESFWWVTPSRRGRSHAGSRLLRAFVEWGRANVDWVILALEAGSPVRDESLGRFGFKRVERSFLLEV